MTTTIARIPGTAPIKAEFLAPPAGPSTSSELLNEKVIMRESTSVIEIAHAGTIRRREEDAGSPREGEPPTKKPKPSGAQRKRLAKEAKQKQRGQNKARRFLRVSDEVDVCWKVACSLPCEGPCRGSHDLPAYIASKPSDLYWTPTPILLKTPPFVSPRSSPLQIPYEEFPSIDAATICPYYGEHGRCKYGFKCRFLGGHIERGKDGTLVLLTDPERTATAAITAVEKNSTEMSVLKSLRRKEFPLPRAREYEEKVLSKPEVPEVPEKNGTEGDDDPEPIIIMPEKKRLHWEGLTYLAPLTTVGNMPFRRLCSSLGCDITCGEMGLAVSFLQGSKEEWSLVRRHPSERIFGVQIAGNTPATLTSTAEAIGRQCEGNIDFVDLNCGCPIDLVYQQGAGSALLSMGTRLGKMVNGMSYALGDIPVTVKMRTGVKDNLPTAHKLFPKAHAWGAGAVSLHGRSRQQRYSREADWTYIKRCVSELREYEEENGLPKMPFWGNGDCYSWQQYDECLQASGVDGILIGRGGLIKPWIFTEIKEQRVWDISSRERLDLARQYAEFGLSHWGTDTAGVNTTRRYLCEALSFWYRYIPVGLLEYLPPKLNDRAPAYQGRDELETLLASGDSRVWVQISEMFLGPAPTGWTFTPKHKSNSYSTADVDDQTTAQG